MSAFDEWLVVENVVGEHGFYSRSECSHSCWMGPYLTCEWLAWKRQFSCIHRKVAVVEGSQMACAGGYRRKT